MDRFFEQQKEGSNPFIPVFEQIYRLERSRYYTDVFPGNVLLDFEKGEVNLVDQQSSRREEVATHAKGLEMLLHSKEQLMYNFTKHGGVDKVLGNATPEEKTRYDGYCARLSSMMDEAIHVKLTAPEPSVKEAQLAFKKVTQVKAISLDAPPKHLFDALRKLDPRGSSR